MSWFIATGINIKNNGNIEVSGYDNNVFPKISQKYPYNGDKYDLFVAMCAKRIQPRPSANGYKWAYIMEMVKRMVEQNGDKLGDIYTLFNKGENTARIELYKSLFDSILSWADSVKKGKYKLKSGMYFVGDNAPGNKRWYLTENKNEAQIFPAYKALYYSMTRNLNLIEVK